jgi:hypothetical protein
MTNKCERRVEPRLDRTEILFARIVSCPEGPDPIGKTIKCTTVDMSISGLKLQMEEAVAQGSQVELWVKLGGHDAKLLLAGEVKWCMEKAKSHLAGIKLGVGITDDLGLWKELLSSTSS